MQQKAAQRAWEELHPDGDNGKPWHDGSFKRWSSKRSDVFPFHRDDGVTIFVAPVDLNPDDDFLAPPPPPVSVTSLLGGPTDDEGEVLGGDTS